MATTTKSRKGTPSKRGSGKKSRSSSRARSKGSSSRSSSKRSASRSSSGRSGPSTTAKVGQAFRTHVGDQARDAAGIALILFGVLVGLGMYVHAAGPVGAFLEAIFRGLLGVYGYVVPPLTLYFGVMVVLDRPSHDVGRIAVGLVLTFIGVIGGWHLIAGQPQPAEGIRALWPAGGLVGWAISAPLAAGLSPWGAGAVLLALLGLGLLIVTQTPVADLVKGLRSGARRAASQDTAPATTSRRKTKAASGADTDASSGDDADEDTDAGRTRRRAKIADYRNYEQPPLDASDTPEGEGNGQSAADRLAGRIPAPPTPSRATVDPELTKDGQRKAAKVAPITSWEDYRLPPLDLLPGGKSKHQSSKRHIEAQVNALQETFDQFGIDAQVARWSRGPTVTRFEIELGPGVQVKKVANMGDDIAYALAAPDVRIVAPIPGKSAIGVEVPNRERDLITLGDILRSDDAQANPHPLYVALGVDIAGNPALVNLATMPHLLVSGATGSGKSVTLNAMITSILVRSRPDQVRMILVDPKRVELNHYDGAPHLLTPVVTDPKRATDAVQWAVKEMEMRYDTLARLGFRNIDSYNEAVAKDEIPAHTDEEREAYRPMPYILLVIDELSDLMLVAPRDVEDAICRIAQMARAVGIHMVIATQRPSVDVITGLIKANIPSRLALAVASQTDSRTILDMAGAEKLVGNGDLLFLPASQGKPSRLQGCFVSEREIDPIVKYAKAQREAVYVEGVVKEGRDAEDADLSRGSDDDSDATLTRRAAEQVVNSGLGSTSMLQRKLRIGFARAGRIMDELEQLGVVGPNEGSKARDVLWSPEDLDNALEQGQL